MKLDLDALEKRARGSEAVVMCDHPDVGEAPADPTVSSRRCVIDDGLSEACEMSSSDVPEADRIQNKLDCPYWKPVQNVVPQGASPEETLAMIERLRRAEKPPVPRRLLHNLSRGGQDA